MVQRGTKEIILNHRHADDDQWFVRAIGEEWYRQYIEAGKHQKPMALPQSRWRASWAGSCSRFIAYKAAEIEESDPHTMANAYTFMIGTDLHDCVQGVMEKLYPEARCEVKVRIGKYGSGHADVANVLIHDPDGIEPPIRFLIEMKSINGTGWRKMFGQNGEGPRYQAVMQAAVNAYGMPEDERPDFIIVAVWSLEASQPDIQHSYGMPEGEQGRFSAQWTYNRDEYTTLAREEIKRMEYIIDIVDSDGYEVIPRIIPDPHMPAHEVSSPRDSQYRARDGEGFAKKAGKTWHCNYCTYQSTCHERLIDENIYKAEREREREVVEATIIEFPGAREATPEELLEVETQFDQIDTVRHPSIPQATRFQIGQGESSE